MNKLEKWLVMAGIAASSIFWTGCMEKVSPTDTGNTPVTVSVVTAEAKKQLITIIQDLEKEYPGINSDAVLEKGLDMIEKWTQPTREQLASVFREISLESTGISE